MGEAPKIHPSVSCIAISSLNPGSSKARATHKAPVVTSLGFRAAAAADLSASLARLLSPVLDVLIRLWLAEGFLVKPSYGDVFGPGRLDGAVHVHGSRRFTPRP